MWIAQITQDHIWRPGDTVESRKDKLFDKESCEQWWGWPDSPFDDNELPETKTTFKLYDNDDELYYEGWLLNDEECIVQQFVLKWAEVDSGCTVITVYKDSEAGYVQEIA